MSAPNNLNDATDILSAFVPNRAFRRANAGANCGMCGLGITAPDFALVEIDTAAGATTRSLHKQCTSLLWEMVENLRRAEESPPAEEDAGGPRGAVLNSESEYSMDELGHECRP